MLPLLFPLKKERTNYKTTKRITMKYFNLALIALLTLIPTFTWAQSLPSGYVPCAVSNMQCKWVVEDGKNNVEISFTTPTQATKYDMQTGGYVFCDMDVDITSVVVQRITNEFNTIQTIKSFSNPEKGAELSYTDENLAYGSYMYRVIVRAGGQSSSEWDWDNAIRSVIVGQVPADFTNNDVHYTVDGKTVTITYTIPAVSSLGEPMVMPINCTVAEVSGSEPPTYTTLDTKENAEPGQTYTFVKENVSEGMHTYALQARTASGANNGIYRYCMNVFVGLDAPGLVRNAKAKKTDNGILVSWEAPVKGMNGGNIGNVEDLTYSVYRKASIYDATGRKVASDISDCSFTDVVEVSTQTTIVYEIIAKNSKGEGNGAHTNNLVLGDPLSLPFVENIETVDGYGNISFDNQWQKDYGGSFCTWYTASGSFWVNDANPSVIAYQGNGFAYAMYSSWGMTNKWDSLTSPLIDFSESKHPTLTFWLYDTAQGGSDMTLSVQSITENSDVITEATIPLGEAEQNGWRPIEVELKGLKNAPAGQIRLRTDAYGSNCYAVLIDQILVKDVEGEDPDPGDNPGDNPGGDPDTDPTEAPDPIVMDEVETSDSHLQVSAYDMALQLQALGMSDNHRFITGLNVSTYRSFIWDTETNTVYQHAGDHVNSDFRSITDDGVAYGILSPDGSEDMMDVHTAHFGTDGEVTIDTNSEMTQVFDVTPDGTIAVGCILDEMWLPTPCLWKNGERLMLPLPSSAEAGIEHDGANAMFVSADGKIIAGYLQDWMSSRPAIIWRQQNDGSYKAEVISKDYWELYAGQGKTYLRFEPLGLSSNGKWLALSLQHEPVDGIPMLEKMGRMDLETLSLTESSTEMFDYFNPEEQSYYPTAIANDGTCVGSLSNFDGVRQGLVWFASKSGPQLLADVLPEVTELQDYDFFMNTPVAISPDAKFIAGYGLPITWYDDGPDYDFVSYLINMSDVDGIATIKTHNHGSVNAFNILGQRINKDAAKGIIIENGRKILKK